jgi:uncharacterized membrane protein
MLLLLFASLAGSYVNIPLKRVRAQMPPLQMPPVRWGLLHPPQPAFSGETVIALNVGGALIPTAVSLYLMAHLPDLAGVLAATAVVAFVCHRLARPVPGLGIAMPLLLPPLVAAASALLLVPGAAPPAAYVSGSLGTLIGADLLHLNEVTRLGAPVASIGGAGTFDGIFFTGILAVLLAG